MAAQNWIKIIENESRIVFAAPKGFHGVVTIEKISIIDVHTIEVIGFTYWVTSSKKYSRNQKCQSLEEALATAEKRMEQLN
jgi:hypothetical protein